ncbi:efflux RND transporter periplasmic adaptor subunit [Vibrio sonorensis]|uniref:efflux RND transporter periplasmic adaptor subunit n=1 Tax=Vibrio sonorensis TaxID=1004316 RepID=UPI0008D98320|nr:efflux RND transporter periplasmic adaptor subunit [Vibrio sonorensis]
MRRKTLKSSLLVASLPLVLSACTESQGEEKQPLKLITVQSQSVVLRQQYQVEREYVGVVTSGQRANLGFELSGKVSNVLVDVGDIVEQGQPLVTLDTKLLFAERQELLAQLKEIRSQEKLNSANLSRQYALKDKGFSSESEIDTLTSKKESLAANALRIQSALDANQLKSDKSTIRAPYSGIISKRFVSIGDVVATGTATLSLLSTDQKEAVIGVSRQDLSEFENQKQFTVLVNSQPYKATLISKASNVDSNSRSISLRFYLEDSNALLDGELAYLNLNKSYPEPGFWIPTTALTDGVRGTWNVYSLTPEPDHKSVQRRVVNVLYANNDAVYVQGNLQSGEEIIANGLHKVVPGQPVLSVE